MKRFLYIIMTAMMLATMGACSDNNDDMPDDDVIWDIYPAGVSIQLVDVEGNNLLDPEVEGNWVREPMWIGWDDKRFDAIWDSDDLQQPTRAILPRFHGIVWTGVWTDKQYYLNFGELDGASSHDLSLTLGITAINTVFDFEYSHCLVWKNKEPHFDDHITYDGKRIDGNKLTLVLPKNNQ